MEKAIQKAIEGNYRMIGQNYDILSGGVLRLYRTKDNATTALLDKETLLVDPNFWRCLVTALANDNKGLVVERSGATFLQHDFIDYVANGGEVEEFFSKLLSR